jgi:hypothetical protein
MLYPIKRSLLTLSLGAYSALLANTVTFRNEAEETLRLRGFVDGFVLNLRFAKGEHEIRRAIHRNQDSYDHFLANGCSVEMRCSDHLDLLTHEIQVATVGGGRVMELGLVKDGEYVGAPGPGPGTERKWREVTTLRAKGEKTKVAEGYGVLEPEPGHEVTVFRSGAATAENPASAPADVAAGDERKQDVVPEAR